MTKYKTTSYQKRLWFLYQTNRLLTAYTVGIGVMLNGNLRQDILQKSLNFIVKKHEIFRSNFLQEKNDIFQVITPKLDVPLRLAGGNKEVNDFIYEELDTPFDLKNGPLIRAALLSVSDSCHVLCITCHHIIVDENSIEIVLKDLTSTYNNYLSFPKNSNYPGSKIQFSKYLGGIKENEDVTKIEKGLDFWKQNLKNLPSVCTLPSDYLRPSILTYSGKTVRFRLKNHIVASLKKLFSKNAYSPFIGFLSIFELLLYRYTSQKDIVVGSPFSDRLKFELEDTVGFYSNTLILRTILNSQDDFLEIMAKNKKTIFAAYEHSDVPFEKIVDKIACERSLDKNPLFQVMFTYNPYIPHEDIKFEGLDTKILPIDYNTSKFDLTLFVNECKDGVELVFEYSTELFKDERIQNLAKHYEELAKAILIDPNKKIEEIDFLSPQEKSLIVGNFGKGRKKVYGIECLHKVFERRVKEKGEAIAVVFDDKKLSYSALNEKANQLAHYLRKSDVKPNDLVAVLLERSLELPVAILGILKSGGAYVPLDIDYPLERISFMLKDAKAKIVVTHSKFASVFSDYQGKIIYIDKVNLSAESIENPLLVNSEKDIAYVIYTSGSTGTPKGVMVEHRNVYRLMKTSEKFYDFSGEDVWALFHSYAFDFSVWEMWGAWFYGGKLCIVPYVVSRSPELLYEFLEKNEITVLNQTPSAFKNLAGYDRNITNSNLKLRYIIFGGEALNSGVLKDWMDKYGDEKPKLVNMYGITETTVHVTFKLLKKKDLEDKGSLIGEPLPDLEVYIMDEHKQLTPIGVKGEMYVGGGGVTRGYLNRNELTQERYIAHPFRKGERLYKTGDLGRYRFDGNLEYCGRADRQVKIRGYRIETGEIESEILRSSDIRSTYVRSIKNDNEDSLIAYVVLKGEKKDGSFIGQLKEDLKRRLPSYMIPSTFMILEKLPLTVNGKILEAELPLPGIQERQSVNEYVEARTESEKQLVEIWKDVLKINKVGVKDNFFSLGGDSILALKIISLLRKRYYYDLDLKDIFQYPIILEQSLRLKPFLKNDQSVSKYTSKKIHISPFQKRFWILYRLFPNSVYNIQMSWEIKGELNTNVLEESFIIFLKRNKFLMSYFRLEDNDLVSYYSSDFSKCFCSTSCVSRVEALKFLESISKTIFNLEEGPLFIGYLICTGKNEYIFSIISHHIVFDGNSKNILIRELSNIYNSLLSNKHIDTSFHNEQYFRESIVPYEKYQAQKRYWMSNLSDILDNYRIMTDFQPPLTPTFNGKCFRFYLSESLKDGITAISINKNISLFNFLLTVFESLSICYSGGNEFIVGIPSNVNVLEDDLVTGMSVNTLPIRLYIDSGDTFLDVAQRVQQTVLSALQHQELPFDEIASALNKNFSLEYNPIFQSMFMLEYDTKKDLKLKNLRIKRIELDSTISKFDLTFLAKIKDDGIECVIEYSSDLYKNSTISRFANHFQQFLKSITHPGNCDKNIFELMANQNEEDGLLYKELNDTDKSFNENFPVYRLIDNQTKKAPHSTAVIFGKQVIAYEKLKSLSESVVNLLHQSNVCKNFPISICIERSVEMMATILGVWKYGGFYLPIDPSLPNDRISYILNDSQTNTILTTMDLRQKLFKNFLGNVICVDNLENTITEIYSEFSPKLYSPAYMIYTSGSTGAPKGVLINHNNLLNVVEFFLDYCKISDKTFWLAESSISFDISILELILPLIRGGKIYIASREEQRDPYKLKEIFKRRSISHFQATPTLLKLLMDVEWIPNKSLMILSGGENLSNTLASYLLKHVPYIINVYGPTETTIWSSASLITKDDNITIGRPIYNTYFYVLNSVLQKVPVGTPGDLYIGGKGIADCYWNRPELTAQKFIANPFRNGEKMYCTGDRVRCLSNGEIEYLNRSDSQIKLRGYRIELEEIEKNIEKISWVLVAAVNVVNLKKGPILVAYVQPKTKKEVKKDEVKSFLRSILPTYMIPDEIMIVDSIPKLPNGKISRKDLSSYKYSLQKAEDFIEHDEPSNYLQVILKSVWSSVLEHNNYDINSNFFEIGGNSLLVVKLMSELKQILEVQLSVIEIFQHPTIKSLSKYIESKKKRTPMCVISYKNDNSNPIFFIHPAGGSAHPYFALKHYIHNRVMYGISDIYAGLSDSPLKNITDMAKFYVQEIEKIRKIKNKHYIFIGWSFGGIVALEMAQQLCAAGKIPEKLLLIDSFNNHAFSSATIEKLYNSASKTLESGYIKNQEKRYQRYLYEYVPQIYPHEVTLLKADLKGRIPDEIFYSKFRGWEQIIQKLNVDVVSGDHDSIFDTKYLSSLAEKIVKYIDLN